MRPSIRVSMLLGAVLLAGAALYVFSLGRTADPRLADDALAALEARLARIEKRLVAGGARKPTAPVNEAAPPTEGRSPEDQEVEEDDEATDGDLTTVLARLDVIETRLRGLEVDPVERAFSFLQSGSASLRRDGVRALERIAQNDPQARDAIRQMLLDPDPQVRSAAADSLADIEDKAAVPQLLGLLADPEASVRREALGSLGELEAKDAAPDVAGLLKDPDPRVRQEAADVLGGLQAKDAAEFLTAALADADEEVRGEAIASIGEVGAASAAPVLRDMYTKDPGPHRLRLALALQKLGDGGPMAAEIQRLSATALGDANENVRTDAIRTLSRLAGREAESVYKQALEDTSQRVRREAERALARR